MSNIINPKGEYWMNVDLYKTFLPVLKSPSIAQTMGPNWRTIYWLPNKIRALYCTDERVNTQLKSILNKV